MKRTEESILEALKHEYPHGKITSYFGFYVVKEKNLDTNKNEFHLFGWNERNKGFICTMPTYAMALDLADALENEEE